MKSWQRIPLESPRLTVLAVLALTVAAGVVCARGLRVDNTIDAFLPAGDPELARYERFRAVFGEDNFLMLAWDGLDLDDEAVVARLGETQFAVAGLPGVGRVTGPFVRASDGVFELGEGVRLADRLADREHGAAAFLVEPAAALRRTGTSDLFAEIESLLDRSGPAERAHIAGPEAINHFMDLASNRSFSRLFPIVVLLIGAILWVATRRLRLVAGILLAAAIASVWTLACLVLAGRSFNMVVSVIPALLVVLGPAYSLHLASALRRAPGPGRRERWAQAGADTLRPCLMTAATTAAGLAALAFADILPVKDLGLFAGVGVLFSFCLVFCFLPAFDLALPAGERVVPAAAGPARALRFHPLEWIQRQRFAILAGAAAAAIAAGFGISRLHVQSHILSFFPQDHPLVRATAAIEETLTGLTPIEIWISGPRQAVLAPATVVAARRLEESLRGEEDVTGVFGPLAGDPRLAALSAEQVARLLDGGAAFERFTAEFDGRLRVESDRVDVRWTVAARTTAIEQSAALRSRIEEQVRTLMPAGLTASVTGAIPILVELQALLLRTQIRTFAVSLLIVTVILALAFRSLRLALLSLVPNVLPILMTLGSMGYLGIPLNVATVTVASIALGLVVDDTIHFLDRFARGQDAGGSVRERLEAALSRVGRPILFTSLATAIGFSAFTMAAFQPTFYFGLLVAATALFALVCDLVLLPALILMRP